MHFGASSVDAVSTGLSLLIIERHRRPFIDGEPHCPTPVDEVQCNRGRTFQISGRRVSCPRFQPGWEAGASGAVLARFGRPPPCASIPDKTSLLTIGLGWRDRLRTVPRRVECNAKTTRQPKATGSPATISVVPQQRTPEDARQRRRIRQRTQRPLINSRSTMGDGCVMGDGCAMASRCRHYRRKNAVAEP